MFQAIFVFRSLLTIYHDHHRKLIALDDYVYDDGYPYDDDCVFDYNDGSIYLNQSVFINHECYNLCVYVIVTALVQQSSFLSSQKR